LRAARSVLTNEAPTIFSRLSVLSRLLVLILAVTVSACSTPLESSPPPPELTGSKTYQASDPENDVSLEFSKGDKDYVETAEGTVDIIGTSVTVSSEMMIARIETSMPLTYVPPTSFAQDAIVDRVFTYYFYLETTGDGSFDYRLSATNNYDTGMWEGEFWANGEEFSLTGGSEFSGFVVVDAASVEIHFPSPFGSISGELWAICPGAEFSYSKVANEVPDGSDLADFIWNGKSEDIVLGSDDSPTCIAEHFAPIVFQRSDLR
jgi:hypothetical protein